jgi:hypothetical protein
VGSLKALPAPGRGRAAPRGLDPDRDTQRPDIAQSPSFCPLGLGPDSNRAEGARPTTTQTLVPAVLTPGRCWQSPPPPPLPSPPRRRPNMSRSRLTGRLGRKGPQPLLRLRRKRMRSPPTRTPREVRKRGRAHPRLRMRCPARRGLLWAWPEKSTWRNWRGSRRRVV